MLDCTVYDCAQVQSYGIKVSKAASTADVSQFRTPLLIVACRLGRVSRHTTACCKQASCAFAGWAECTAAEAFVPGDMALQLLASGQPGRHLLGLSLTDQAI